MDVYSASVWRVPCPCNNGMLQPKSQPICCIDSMETALCYTDFSSRITLPSQPVSICARCSLRIHTPMHGDFIVYGLTSSGL